MENPHRLLDGNLEVDGLEAGNHAVDARAEIVGQFQAGAADLAESAHRFEGVGVRVSEDISGSLVHFQFQDRVGQILQNVIADMEKFAHRLEHHPDRMELEDWLADLERTYTTAEQQAILSRSGIVATHKFFCEGDLTIVAENELVVGSTVYRVTNVIDTGAMPATTHHLTVYTRTPS